jgi:hypothetical protein
MRRLSVVILLALIGCSSDNLSRESAAEILRKDFPRPYVFKVYTAVPQQAKIATESTLEADGLINVERVQKLADVGKPFISFTEKARPFLLETSEEDRKENIQNVKIGDEEFGEVTGIKLSGDGKSAVVEYTANLENITPFASIMPRKITKTTTTNKAKFGLYDDGWRLEGSN